MYDFDFDKGRREEKEEKKFSDSMPRHFPEKMAEAKRTVIVFGDMNVDLKKHPMNNLTKSLTDIGFQQIVLSPTHIMGGILDHVYAYCKTSAKCTLCKIHPLYYSDHDAVSFFLEI